MNNKSTKMNVKALFIKLQLEYCVKLHHCSLKLFPFNIYPTASSSACPKNPQQTQNAIKTPLGAQVFLHPDK